MLFDNAEPRVGSQASLLSSLVGSPVEVTLGGEGFKPKAGQQEIPRSCRGRAYSEDGYRRFEAGKTHVLGRALSAYPNAL